MPAPTISDVQPVDPILTNMLIGYQQADDRFVASKICPIVPVERDSGQFFIATKKYFFFDDLKARAAGGQFPELNFGLSTASYATLQYAGSFRLADEIRANSQVPMDLEQLGARRLAQASLIRKEVAFAGEMIANNQWGTTDNNATTNWSDTQAGDPLKDVIVAQRTVSNNTGVKPNTVMVGNLVDQALLLHPDVIDRLKYTQAAIQATVEKAMADMLGCDNYWVARGSYTNTNEAASFSGSAIISDAALVVHVDPGAGLFGATGAKTFVWQPGGGVGAVYMNRDNNTHSDQMQQKEQWDQKIVASDLGYLFLQVV